MVALYGVCGQLVMFTRWCLAAGGIFMCLENGATDTEFLVNYNVMLNLLFMVIYGYLLLCFANKDLSAL